MNAQIKDLQFGLKTLGVTKDSKANATVNNVWKGNIVTNQAVDEPK